ncbi:hypothetical protein [Streptomyces yangpuensis]|uniref:hypothetical protein n=1 Tax=Streptomyces yangpuensis TaxID=1648182 RepID=UPI0037F734D1
MIRRAAAARMVVVDPELEAFVPFLPGADWAEPTAVRAIYTELAASRPAPDLTDVETEHPRALCPRPAPRSLMPRPVLR